MGIMLFGAFISVLNQTLLTAALPSIMRDMNVAANQVQWLTTGFMLVNGIMVPVSAFLINRLTNRQLYLGAMTIFACGTTIAALAPNFHILLIARILQAMGAGVIMPMMYTVMLSLFPKEKRGYAMGIAGIVISFAPALGPTLSGALVETLSWHALFYVITPIAVIDIIFAAFAMRNITKQTKPRLDILSVVLSTIGFGGLLYGVSEAGTTGWGSKAALIPIVIGLITLVLFVWRQLTIKEPLLELRVFKSRSFLFGTLISMLAFALMISAENQLPMYIQTVRGQTPLFSGLTLLPGAIIVGILSPITGKLFDKYGPRLLALLGLSLVVIGTFVLAGLTITTPFIWLTVIYAVRMLGISMLTMPMTTWGINGLDNRYIAHGTAVNNTTRQVMASITTAVMITVMTMFSRQAQAAGVHVDEGLAMLHGINMSFLAATGIAVFLLVIALFFVHDYENIAAIHKQKAKANA